MPLLDLYSDVYTDVYGTHFDVGEETLWIDADGVASSLEVDWDVSGRFMPKPETQVDSVPGQPGALLRQVRHGVREFTMVIWVHAVNEATLRADLRSLVARMDPTRGVGKIRVTSPIGDQREINCYYAAGLDMAEKLGDSSGPDFQRIPLQFVAYDPYWYDTSPISKSFTLTEVPSFFPVGGVPMIQLTSSQLVVDDTVINNGDVEAWPVWTITGPGSAVRLVNESTGEFVSLPSLSLTNSEVITVDSRPDSSAAVTLQDGTNLYPELDATSTLWALQRGTNAIRLEMTGITTASALSVSYYQRYLSA